jgi:hypothetical protein
MARVTLALAFVASLTIAAPPAARAAGGCHFELDDDPYLDVRSLRRFGRTIVWQVGEQRSFEFRSASEC